ncbi:hypothetical protein KVT40_000695 [Elsinoe batatas]|uniref:BTB domain-containing protein n=1 Tax=Elsinoe batatas TaxID=2601811 RepID=A0A8K0LCI3_9PEZI|nr:hypothetical protein KVT40_000695 [Elsinoe batatas]
MSDRSEVQPMDIEAFRRRAFNMVYRQRDVDESSGTSGQTTPMYTPTVSEDQSDAASDRSTDTLRGKMADVELRCKVGANMAKQNSDMILLLCGHPRQAHWVHRHVLVRASAALEERLREVPPFATLDLRCAYTPFEVGAFIEWAYTGSYQEAFSSFGAIIDDIQGNNDHTCGLMHLHRFATDVEATVLVKKVEEDLAKATKYGVGNHVPDPTSRISREDGTEIKRGFENYQG